MEIRNERNPSMFVKLRDLNEVLLLIFLSITGSVIGGEEVDPGLVQEIDLVEPAGSVQVGRGLEIEPTLGVHDPAHDPAHLFHPVERTVRMVEDHDPVPHGRLEEEKTTAQRRKKRKGWNVKERGSEGEEVYLQSKKNL